MSKLVFTPHERYAVFTVHGEKCYLCSAPLDLFSMEVEHIIPESLGAEPSRLADVLKLLGRAPTFDLNSYENWMPACRKCNGRKGDLVFEPSLLTQTVLQRAAARATDARALEATAVTKRKLSLAINTLARAAEERALDDGTKDKLRGLLDEGDALRTPERQGKELRLAPLITLVHSDQMTTVVRGPYGVGGGPTTPTDAMRCPSCGNPWFSGARCVTCGTLYDD